MSCTRAHTDGAKSILTSGKPDVNEAIDESLRFRGFYSSAEIPM